MNKLSTILFAVLIFAAYLSQAQTKSCCSANASAEFAMLGENKSFQAAHLSPEPINFQAKKGMMVSFPTPDGKTGNAFMVPALTKTDNYLFVFHEWWGLNDHIKQEAERLAEDLPGVIVIAIDLYDGQIATNAEDAAKIMGTVKQERGESIINGTLNYIRSSASIQTIGWCFGGGWSLQATILAGAKSKGCVIYYGMPEKNIDKLKKFNAPVLGIFASKDGWINQDVVGNFEKQMKELKKPLELHWFDADHAFANPSNPKFDSKSAAEARKLSLEFIKKNFN